MVDIAIVGGGPAGLTAGLYAARGGASAVLFEEVFAGGQAAKTHKIDNYPGFEEGIEGMELGQRMQLQAVRFGLEMRYEPVTGLRLLEPVKGVETSAGVTEARTVILCTGAVPRKLGLPNEEALIGAGVSFCASCDGAFFRGKEVAVVGGGDTALGDALYLARFASKVYLIHRRDELRGCAMLQKAVRAEPKAELLLSSAVTALSGETLLSGITVEDLKTEKTRQLPVSGLFVAVGAEPRVELVRGALELTESGYIGTDAKLHTSAAGVFAAGDVRDTPLRQVVTAVADGALAAAQALEYLTLAGRPSGAMNNECGALRAQ